jgi:subtilisin-like proprotein convertase family protein
VAHSTDDGVTWSDPEALASNANNGDYAQVATDGTTWVAVWRSVDNLGGTIGNDLDVLVSRSTDVGVTWTDAVPLNTNAAVDSAGDDNPQITTDGAGNWVAVWASGDSLGGEIGTDPDILVSRSTDDGLTWSDPAPLNTNATSDSEEDNLPQVTTDGTTWVAVWRSDNSLDGTIGADWDILMASSTDAGATWTDPAPLNLNAATDSGGDASPVGGPPVGPQLATDRAGDWVAVWGSTDSLGNTIDTDRDILFATTFSQLWIDDPLPVTEGDQSTLTVHLNGPHETTVTVDYATSNGTAEADSDFTPVSGTLIFTPGETSKTIIVPTIDDAAPDDNEVFFVELSNTIGGATIVDDRGKALIVEPVTYENNVAKVLTDAKNAARPGVTTSTIEVTGAGKVYDLNVELDISHTYVGQLTATLYSPDGTAVALFSNVGGSGANFTATVLDDQATTSITAGSAPFNDTFQPEGSLAAFNGLDAAGTWTLEITDGVKGDSGTLNSWSIDVTVLPPTVPGITVEPTSGLATTEDGGTDTFSVVLDSRPIDNVTIDLWSDNTAEGTVSPTTLTFTPQTDVAGGWNVPQTVTITGVDDIVEDGSIAYTIVLAPASSNDAAYNGRDPADVPVSNHDNDSPVLFFESEDVPMTIADPHPRKGPRAACSELLIESTGITVDLIDIGVSIDHASLSDLTEVRLQCPSGGPEAWLAYDGAEWDLVDPAFFSGKPLDGFWFLTIIDTEKNDVSGTLNAWSITITPLIEGATASSQSAAAVDMALVSLVDPDSSEDDTEMLNTAAADDLALLLIE